MKKQIYKSPRLKGEIERKQALKKQIYGDFINACEHNKRCGRFGKRIFIASSLIDMAEAFSRTGKQSEQMYFDAETARLAKEKREASRAKRLAEKLRLAKMAGNKGSKVI